MGVLIDDSSMEVKYRLGVVGWNFFIFTVSWWMFGFDKFQLLQALIVAFMLMAASSVGRRFTHKEILDSLPSKHKVESKFPSRELMEARLTKTWESLHAGLVFTKEMLVFQVDEYEKM